MTAWFSDTARICQRISDSLDEMGYVAPEAGRTSSVDALIMIADALEDLANNVYDGTIDAIRANLDMARHR